MESPARPWLLPPRLRRAEAGAEERRATWLELFFDLVFVLAIAELAQQLIRRHDAAGFAIFAALYLPVFIAWQGFTFYADRFDTDDVLFRIVLLVGMLAVAALAVQVPEVAEGRRETGFVIAYVILRSLVIGLYLRARRHVPEARALIDRYVGGYGLSVALWLLSLAFDGPARFALWGIGLAIEYAMPVIAQRLHRQLPVDAAHVPERFALFTMIVLGESVVAVGLGTAQGDWQAGSATTAALGFVAVACLWWIYFDRGAVTGITSAKGSMQTFTRIHIPLLAALTAVGAGVHLLIDEAARGGVDGGAAWAFDGAAAVFLLCVTVAQTLGDRRVPTRPRAVVGSALVAIAAVSSPAGVAATVVTALSATVLVGLVCVEIRSALLRG